MFLDQATIEITGGRGGDGCIAWRREKYVPKGGPAGGDGGRGGNVYFIADPNTDTLSDYHSQKRFSASNGSPGSGSRRHGKDGEDLYLKVPPGTIITSGDTVIADLKHTGEQVCAATGGRGGFGNAHFKSSTRQRPDFSERGEAGDQVDVHLELKLVADVGIIGYPSVGKSTLISVISNARPKIAEYQFTTLVPNLGVVTVDSRAYVVCDVPGLIEGASEGKGLGDKFLRHIERCGALVHVLDISRAMHDGTIDAELLIKDYQAIRHELEAFSPTLMEKREVVVLNKIDLTQDDITPVITALEAAGITVFLTISAATHGHTDELQKKLLTIVLEERDKRTEAEAEEIDELPVLAPHLDDGRMGSYRVEVAEDGTVHIYGKRIEQFARMTDFSNEGGLLRFKDVIDRIGLKKAIRRENPEEKAEVYVGEVRIDQHLYAEQNPE